MVTFFKWQINTQKNALWTQIWSEGVGYMTVFGIESIRSPTHKIYVPIGPSVNYYYYFFNFKNKFNRAL